MSWCLICSEKVWVSVWNGVVACKKGAIGWYGKLTRSFTVLNVNVTDVGKMGTCNVPFDVSVSHDEFISLQLFAKILRFWRSYRDPTVSLPCWGALNYPTLQRNSSEFSEKMFYKKSSTHFHSFFIFDFHTEKVSLHIILIFIILSFFLLPTLLIWSATQSCCLLLPSLEPSRWVDCIESLGLVSLLIVGGYSW